jgi:pantetheine-phosphate adenylyltransferase
MSAIYPGSFDPVTNGHIDVIERAVRLFDHVIVAVAHNEGKSPLFSMQERQELLAESLSHLSGVEIVCFEGLLVDLVRERGVRAVIRGLRAVSDFEFEFQMALMNRKLEPEFESVFLMPREDYTYLSSRIVKEIARLGGNVSAFVPPCVAGALRARCAAKGARHESSS